MAEFSADKVPSHMPARPGASPRTGEINPRVMKPRGSPGRKPGLGRPSPPKGEPQPDQSVGRPAPPEPDPNQPQDLSHLPLVLQHFNMKGLGRDLPYMVWATLTGNYQQYAEPGRPPYDILED